MADKITINLGVAVVPYESEIGSNTGEVAEELERRYGVISHFVDAHFDEIQDLFLESATGAVLERMHGGESSSSMNEALSGIEEMFRDFIDASEIEGMGVPGVPTKAALNGVNHRLKTKKGTRRPSFKDTGLYSQSFKAWEEDK